jgi:DNA polymerase-3 subunit delta'
MISDWLLKDKKHLADQYINNALPHAIIFSGVKGVGKNKLAKWLVSGLLCHSKDKQCNDIDFSCGHCKSCDLLKSATHPDHLQVELNGLTIGVDQIRAVSRMFEKTAQLSLNQTVIIQHADKMTESAANALLKTLEEPSNNSFIILLVKDQQRLLPTIISRCYHLALAPPVGDKLLTELGQNSTDKFANLSHLSELTDVSVREEFVLMAQYYVNYLMTQKNRMAFLNIVLNNEHSVRWLEKITVDLSRSYQWQTIEQMSYLGDQFDQKSLMLFVKEHIDCLSSIYTLINEFSKQVLLLTQMNKEYCLEKLLVQFADLMQTKPY